MKSGLFALLPLLSLTAPVSNLAAEQLIPAGSLIQCTVSEPKLSSKTEDIGDPVLCRVGHVEAYGRSVLPYGSYLVGRFEDYKDPGHLWGKGWMELKFERLVLPPDQIVPLSAKVVNVPKYPVDKEGKVHGTGHPVRDAVEWSIPVLWPIDLINLPRRGPRPTLKPETRLTLKVMDDLGVPTQNQPAYYPPPNRDPYGFTQRTPTSYTPSYRAPMPQPMAQPTYNYTPPVSQVTILMLRTGYQRIATDYWFEGPHQLRYIGTNGVPVIVPADLLDLPQTIAVNSSRGVQFAIRSVRY